MYNTLLKYITVYLGAQMKNQSFALIDINEPCYFDFIYEDIKSNTNAERLNTIFFETIFRIKEVKDILDDSFSAEEMLNNYLQKLSNEKTIKNPLYESISNFRQAVENLNTNMQILDSKNKNAISTDELIRIFFKGNKTQYQKVLKNLKQINEVIAQEVLPNMEMDISLEAVEENDKSNNENPFEVFLKYGLDYNEIKSYLNERQDFLKDAVYFKEKLLKKKITLSKYEKEIKTLIKNYKKYNYIAIHKDTYTVFLIGKRPLLKFLNILIFKIPYSADDKAAVKRFKKSIEIFKTAITKKDLIENTKLYLKYIQKQYPDIFSMTSDRFARVLFIYDWIEYTQNINYLKNLSLKEKIELLQSYYKDINSYEYKTLINELNEFKKFISFLSEFLSKKIKSK